MPVEEEESIPLQLAHYGPKADPQNESRDDRNGVKRTFKNDESEKTLIMFGDNWDGRPLN